jgi:hypothetical protein
MTVQFGITTLQLYMMLALLIGPDAERTGLF